MRPLLAILLLAGCSEYNRTPSSQPTKWTQDAKPDREGSTCILRNDDQPKFCTVSTFEYDGHVCVRRHPGTAGAMECWEKGGP